MRSLAGRHPRAETRTANTHRFGVSCKEAFQIHQMRSNERPLCARSCPWRARNPTSALSPKPDSTRQSRHVRNVPEAEMVAPALRPLLG
jgi:hypothetical protein